MSVDGTREEYLKGPVSLRVVTNRVETSHQHIRQHERQMRECKSAEHDDVQCVSPSVAQPGQNKQEQAVIAVNPRPLDTAT